jgi:hypothetical protein
VSGMTWQTRKVAAFMVAHRRMWARLRAEAAERMARGAMSPVQTLSAGGRSCGILRGRSAPGGARRRFRGYAGRISGAPQEHTGPGLLFARIGLLPLRKSALSPPKRLSAEARKSWQKVVDEYQIVDDTGLIILTTAFEAFDRMLNAQEQIKLEGMTSVDRFGQVKAHQLLTVERDASGAVLGGAESTQPRRRTLGRPARPPGWRRQEAGQVPYHQDGMINHDG